MVEHVLQDHDFHEETQIEVQMGYAVHCHDKASVGVAWCSICLVQLPPYYNNDETGSKNGDEGPTNTGIGTPCVSLLRR